MPEVFCHRGFKFYFYSAEGNPREPVYIHVSNGNVEVKFWLHPSIAVAYNRGRSPRTVTQLETIVELNKSRIEDFWHEEYFR